MANIVKLISVKELLDKKFVIPDYQRGYKWKPQQARDLLDDFYDFIKKLKDPDIDTDSFYCLQPLAVKKKYDLSSFDGFTINSSSDQSDIEKNLNNLESYAQWEVIDGQQRLTSIKLLLSYLRQSISMIISYETRPYSENFLNNIQTPPFDYKENSDFFHMYRVYETINLWFEEKLCELSEKECPNKDHLEIEKKLTNDFVDLLINSERVQFIWYECNEEDPIKVFTRLNIGKIGLTNAELIKAVLLKQSNFEGRETTEVVALQREIANEWDFIEKTLQNDEFWYFIHNNKLETPTRLDYIFDIICKKELLGKPAKKIGNDKYRTFRYIDLFFRNETEKTQKYNDFSKDSNDRESVKPLKYCWEHCVKKIFQAFTDWYNDLIFYHYIGFIVDNNQELICDLYENWANSTKDSFEKVLLKNINRIIKGCYKGGKKNFSIANLLDQQYKYEDGSDGLPDKTNCRPILLLHNILTIIDRNRIKEMDKKFKVPVFYRFPFHQFKNDEWHVEHIDSNTTNDLKEDYDKLLWILQYQNNDTLLAGIEIPKPQSNGILKASDVIEELTKIIVSEYCSLQQPVDLKKWNWTSVVFKTPSNFTWYDNSNNSGNDSNSIFQQLQVLITNALNNNKKDPSVLNDAEKNQIWNFTLLDAGTNCSYGNSIFPAKRRVIIAKDSQMRNELYFEQGKNMFMFKTEPTNESAFIPPVTRNVFMKYYTPDTRDFYRWNNNDATAYKGNIKDLLEKIIK